MGSEAVVRNNGLLWELMASFMTCRQAVIPFAVKYVARQVISDKTLVFKP